MPSRRALILEPELGATNLVVPHHGHLSLLFSTSLADVLAHQLLVDDPPVVGDQGLPTAA